MKIIDELKRDETVKRYIELRKIITSNSTYLSSLKNELSLNNAKIDNLALNNLINEYLELKTMVKNDLEMICNIINDELNVNFLL